MAAFVKRSDVGQLLAEVRELGLGGAARHVGHVLVWRAHAFVDRDFDRAHGVQTSSPAYSWDLNLSSEGDDIGEDEPLYLPTSSVAFRTAIARLPSDLSGFAFVDYGSGMGRTLLLASHHEFDKIIGVEFADELHGLAAENIAAYVDPDQRSTDIVSVHVDATLFDPPDQPCVLYFFHPFEVDVMRKVTTRIRASWEANPRQMFIIYYKPIHRDVLLEWPDVRAFRSGRPAARWWLPNPFELDIYEVPARARPGSRSAARA